MNYTVLYKGKPLPIRTVTIYPAPYHHNQLMEYVQFTPEFPITITIRSEIPVKSAVIRPLSLGLSAEIVNGEISIRLEEPVKFSLEINGGIKHNLLVLAEENRYKNFLSKQVEKENKKQAGNLVYFPAGIHDKGVITITESNTTVYLEEGAYIHGKIDLEHCDNVTVCGYGVITMEKYPYEMRHTYQRCINAMYCRDLVIRDIFITDSNDWSLRVFGCENVLVDNVKIVGCRGNSDGIDVCGSRNVLVQNCFTRVWDDSLVVKALDTGNVENVTFQNCILWNDFARPLEVGVELRADEVKHVRFENIDILHSPTGYPLMGIHHGDRAVVSDIVFDNIRIEDAPGAQLFDIRITPSYWNRDRRMGCIRDIAFRNVRVIGKPGIDWLLSDSRLQGYSKEHDIQGVTFENVEIMGKIVCNAEGLGLLLMDDVRDVKFVSEPEGCKLQMISTQIEMTKEFALQEDGTYAGEVTVYLTRPGRKSPDKEETNSDALEKEVWLQISPAYMGEYDCEVKKVVLPAGEKCGITYPVILTGGKYVIALQSRDPEIRYAWKYVQLDCVISKAEEERRGAEKKALPFLNCYGDRLGSVNLAAGNGSLILRSDLLKRQDCRIIVYAAAPVPRRDGEVLFSVEETDFGIVPAVINGRAGEEAAPQLRCPLEITLVFGIEPKVREIRTVEIQGGNDMLVESLEKDGMTAVIPFEDLGLPADTKHFWLEIEAKLPEVEKYRYPYTLFHSVTPLTAAHMYGSCRVL